MAIERCFYAYVYLVACNTVILNANKYGQFKQLCRLIKQDRIRLTILFFIFKSPNITVYLSIVNRITHVHCIIAYNFIHRRHLHRH